MRRKLFRSLVVTLLLLGDLAALTLAAETAGISGPGGTLRLLDPWMAGYFLAILVGYFLVGLYHHGGNQSRVDELLAALRVVTVITVVLIAAEVVLGLGLPWSPRRLAGTALAFTALDLPFRIILRSAQKALYRFKIGTQRTLIVGTSPQAREIYRQIVESPALGQEVIGFVVAGKSSGAPPPLPVVGDTRALPGLVKALEVDDVIVALENPEHDSILTLMASINGARAEIKILPDLYEVVAGLARTEEVYGLPLIRINTAIITPLRALAKRVIDVWGAALGLIIMAPLMLLLGLLVRRSSQGPAIFSQERVGLRGKRFTIYKFRTMVQPAEEIRFQDDEARITPLGRFLRRTRLDELPQLINVLRGDMSLVGPRPEWTHLVDQLIAEIPYYRRRLMVRPGITGWAQIKGSYDTSLVDARRKLTYDFFYLENLSLRLDLKIMLLTLWVVIRGRGR